MGGFRNLLLVGASTLLSACVLIGGTVDFHITAEGTLVRSEQEACSIRFMSSRTGQPRAIQSVQNGAFKIGFLLHGQDKLSEFTAELSCRGEAWHAVGAADAFAHGSPVILGPIS